MKETQGTDVTSGLASFIFTHYWTCEGKGIASFMPGFNAVSSGILYFLAPNFNESVHYTHMVIIYILLVFADYHYSH